MVRHLLKVKLSLLISLPCVFHFCPVNTIGRSTLCYLMLSRILFAPFLRGVCKKVPMATTLCSVAGIGEAQAELDEFFGAAHAPPERNPSITPSTVPSLQRSGLYESDKIKAPALNSVSSTDAVPGLTHVDASGKAAMVDVGGKEPSARVATASARIYIGAQAYSAVCENQVKKGDVLTTAQLAGIVGAKWTSMLIPLCHNIAISRADVRLWLHEEEPVVCVLAEVRTTGQTGVEMEALTAASVAALTVFDMCKAVTKETVISDLRLEYKSGGKSGVFRRRPDGSMENELS